MARTRYHTQRRMRKAEFVEPPVKARCPRWIQRKMLANLKTAAASCVGRDQARRSRQILEQIEAEQTAAERRKHGEQFAAALPPPPPAERQSPPDNVRRRWPVRAAVKHCLGVAARWVTGLYSRGRRHG